MSITLPIAPQGFIELFRTAAKIWKATILPTFIFYFLNFIFSFLPDIFGFIYPPAALPINQQASTPVVFTSLMLFFIGIFFTVSLYIAILFRTNNIIKFQDLGFGPSLAYGFRRFFPMLGVAILLGLGTVICTLLFIIPGIIFLVYYFYSLYFAVFGKGVFESMTESYQLVKNHWWRSFFVIFTIYFLIFLLFAAIVVILAISYPELADYSEEKINQIMASIPKIKLAIYYLLFDIIVLIPISHFLTSYLLGYFYDLHNRKKLEKKTS